MNLSDQGFQYKSACLVLAAVLTISWIDTYAGTIACMSLTYPGFAEGFLQSNIVWMNTQVPDGARVLHCPCQRLSLVQQAVVVHLLYQALKFSDG